jgi:hypothetical protein
VLAQHDEGDERHHKHRDRSRVVDVAHSCDEDAGEHGAEADENAHGNEELQRIVQVVPQTVAAPAALRHQAQ